MKEAVAPAAEPLGRMTPLRVAIVEDEPFVATLVADMLASSPVAPTLFTLGADLLKSPELADFAVIILDLSLPDIDGFDLMDMLAPMQHKARILLMSGHSQAALRASRIYGNGIGLNVSGVICKPFSRDELLIALAMAG